MWKSTHSLHPSGMLAPGPPLPLLSPLSFPLHRRVTTCHSPTLILLHVPPIVPIQHPPSSLSRHPLHPPSHRQQKDFQTLLTTCIPLWDAPQSARPRTRSRVEGLLCRAHRRMEGPSRDEDVAVVGKRHVRLLDLLSHCDVRGHPRGGCDILRFGGVVSASRWARHPAIWGRGQCMS